jgi:hypothetical protein
VYRRWVLRLSLLSLLVLFAACGVGPGASRVLSTSQALTQPAEWLEFETPAARKELLSEVIKTSALQANAPGAVLFPVQRNGDFRAAPAFGSHLNLLEPGDSGAVHALDFSPGFGAERRDAFQGLSEREVAEQVARALLDAWNISSPESIRVVRTPASPWAAALVENELRLNPSFLYLAAAQ